MATQPQPLSYYLNLSYPYTVAPDGGAFFVEFPDLPNCFTQVEAASDIADMAEEIRTLWIEVEYDLGNSIPEPAVQGEFSGKFVARIPKSLHRDLSLSARREGASLNAYVAYLLAQRHALASINHRLDSFDAQKPIDELNQLRVAVPRRGARRLAARESVSVTNRMVFAQ